VRVAVARRESMSRAPSSRRVGTEPVPREDARAVQREERLLAVVERIKVERVERTADEQLVKADELAAARLRLRDQSGQPG